MLLARQKMGGMQPAMSPMRPGMGNQPDMAALLRTANFDPSTEQSAINNQLQSGRSALLESAPGYKWGNGIAAAPTWSENLANVVRKAYGGYEISQAKERQAALDKRVQEKAEATADIAAIDYEENQEQQENTL